MIISLKLIREGIETSYKMKLEEVLKELEVLEGDVDRKKVYSHKKFVGPMLDYIVADFEKSRMMHGDDTIGGLVVCDSSEQPRNLNLILKKPVISH